MRPSALFAGRAVKGVTLSRHRLKSLVIGLGVFTSGIVLCLGCYIFYFAKGLSYFSSDPKACMNCHVMRDQYSSWSKSGHHAAASCIECHLPHSFVSKYLAKAENGYHHSRAFTFQNFKEPIRIGQKNADILQQNCVECHRAFVHELTPKNTAHSVPERRQTRCVHCHADVGHGARGVVE